MWEKLKTLLRPRLVKIAPKTFGHPVTFDIGHHIGLGDINGRYSKQKSDTQYVFVPSQEVEEFLDQFAHSVNVSDVAITDFIDINAMLIGESVNYGKVTITFSDPAVACIFRLQFLCP